MIQQNFGTCRGCKRTILWTETRNNKHMPCDPEAIIFTPAGGPDTFVTPDGRVVRGKRSIEGEIGYISHFATCPNRAQFKKEKNK